MVWVAVVVAGVIIVVVGLLAVGQVTQRLGPEPERQVFAGDEALSFVAEALPSEVTAVLSYEEVQRIMRLHLDYLHHRGVSRSGGDLASDDDPVVISPEDAVDGIVERGASSAFHPERDHVHEVVLAHLAYFEAIGAMDEVSGVDGEV
jgi:hypothetical protein